MKIDKKTQRLRNLAPRELLSLYRDFSNVAHYDPMKVRKNDLDREWTDYTIGDVEREILWRFSTV